MKTKKAGLTALSVALVAPALALVSAPPAIAAGANINAGNINPDFCGKYMCLYYSPNLRGSGSGISDVGHYPKAEPDLSWYTFYNMNRGGAGHNQPVRNNAASMGNSTTNCNVTTWVYPNWGGNFNWLHKRKWGNLTEGSVLLRNNEASIGANTCT
ncbi:hypothetical protein BZB76_6315 [Actinomadura pelletieri DSM 43383]|uniref:Peptidase inhibitor family I36 n=2 Tax=Actinomadura pelletieri TaxID=111805 RepID=A0A495Q9E9_9ACTN|nr:hypothetical protein BZB76_6315 [Actinomadura pelletieri DSM 43383]